MVGAALLTAVMVVSLSAGAWRSADSPSPVHVSPGPTGLAAASRPAVPLTLVRSLGLAAASTPSPVVGPMVEVNGSLGFFNAEVESAVDPVTGYLYDLWIANDGIGFARSRDGGASFDPAFIVPGSENFYDPATPKVFASSWDPAIVVSAGGVVYAAFMYATSFNNPAGSPYVAVSSDHGATFRHASPVIIPPKQSFSDREFIAVGPDGTVYVTWNFAPLAKRIGFLCSPTGSCSYAKGDFNLLITLSHDQGRTWTTPNVVTPNFPRGGSLEGPVVVGADGEIFVQFDVFATAQNDRLSPGQEWFTSSKDGGVTWSTPFLLSGPYTVQQAVWWIEGTLAIGHDGTLYAAWDVQTDQGDIGFVRYSKDEGVTWSTMIRATPDVNNAAHIMQVAAGEDGIAYVGWLTNNTSSGAWGVYVGVLSTSTNTVTQVVSVSPRLGDPSQWPGDTLGMGYLGGGKVSLAWGADLISTSGPSNYGIFNVVAQFP